MTHPITTAPADTARAMHTSEMRGLDMQDVIKIRITDEDMHESGRYFMDCFRDVASCNHGDTGNYNNPYDGQKIAALWNAHRAGTLITKEECQRRIDAAVAAEIANASVMFEQTVAAEREACAAALDEIADGSYSLRVAALAAGDSTGAMVHGEAVATAMVAAATIRARGQK